MSPLSSLSPLQIGAPGVTELLVIVLVGVVVFGVPLVVVAVVGGLWLRSRGDYEERIDDLETEIARLQAEVGVGSAAGSDDDGDIKDGLAGERGGDDRREDRSG